MASFTPLARFLGLDSPPLLPGFAKSERGVRLPVCGSCGALVAFEGQDAHTTWHQQEATGTGRGA